MDKEINIRTCRRGECPAILELWKASGAIPSTTNNLEALELMLQHENDLLLVAECERRIIGTVMGGWDGWRGNIYRLAVTPEYRRSGIGRALVEEIENRLRLKGVRKIPILVERNDTLANDFWKAMEKSDYKHDPRIIRYTKIL